jgi:hypothetical protein
VSPFDKSGTLRPQVAEVLAIDEESAQRINATLPRWAAEFEAHIMAEAQEVDEPFPEYDYDGPRAAVTLPGDPETAAVYRAMVEELIHGETGKQRGDLLLQASKSWLNERFSLSDQPKTYAAIRHPDGSINLKIKQGGGVSSVGGQLELNRYLPAALIPWFEERLAAR